MKLPRIFGSERKSNPVGQSLVMGMAIEGPRWEARQFIDEGYRKNPVIYMCVEEISKAIAGLEVELWQGDKYLESHHALDMLRKPNPTMGGASLIKAMFVDYLVTGEYACAQSPTNGTAAELWHIDPQAVKIKGGVGGVAAGYVYDNNGKKIEFPVKGGLLNPRADLFFGKRYNPKDYWRGMSPLEAAAIAADTHNKGAEWNYSLLKNGAKPSGIVEFPADGDVSEQTLNRLREWFKAAFMGSKNAGELPILTGGARWQQTSLSPMDMDFKTSMTEAKKLIAGVYGVPLPLIDTDATTFANMEMAKERFYIDTVLPLAEEFWQTFGDWLLPQFGDDLQFKIDKDDIPALESVRNRKFDRVLKSLNAGMLTLDEAREEIGYDAIDMPDAGDEGETYGA